MIATYNQNSGLMRAPGKAFPVLVILVAFARGTHLNLPDPPTSQKLLIPYLILLFYCDRMVLHYFCPESKLFTANGQFGL